MLREILGLALVAVGTISLIAHCIATGRRAASAPETRGPIGRQGSGIRRE